MCILKALIVIKVEETVTFLFNSKLSFLGLNNKVH